jgi:uncharacterized protein (DUF1015 family)
VPRFLPFSGLRYDAARCPAESVTAPPYDVLDDVARDALAARHDANVVRVDVPRDGDDPYATAATTFAAWIDGGLLRRDEPSFYVYRMSWTSPAGVDTSTTGVLGALELSAPEAGQVLPHERTTPKARSDRLDLLRATRANLSPIWALCPVRGFSALLPTAGEPIIEFCDDDRVTHELWRVTDRAAQEAITAAVAEEPVLIADGHHRYETSLAYRDERWHAVGDGSRDPGAGSTLAWVVELADEQLQVGPIHRALGGGHPVAGLLDALASRFDVVPADEDAALAWWEQGRGPCVVTREGWWMLEVRDAHGGGLPDLDSARIDDALCGLDDTRLEYQHDVASIRTRIASGDLLAGLLARPATLTQILAVARGGERMPPKTTFFAPKPRTGLVFRTLDEPST